MCPMASTSLLGSPSDRWSLSRAVDALADAARRAGAPGWIWIAGACYPAVYLNIALFDGLLGLAENYTGVDLPTTGDPRLLLQLFATRYLTELLPDGFGASLLVLLVFLPVFLVFARLVVGLAKISDPKLWETSGERPAYVVAQGLAEESDLGRRSLPLRSAWRAGRGLGLTGLGLWAMLVGLILGAGLVLIGPVVVVVRAAGLEEASPLLTGLLVPPLLVLLMYAVVLMVVNQLALHSLAHNERGVSSALTHAWRLARNAPMSVLRATLVDFVLSIAVFGLEVAIRTLTHPVAWLGPVVLFLLYGFAGVTRAAFWARAYRALGGLSSADRVPGL